MGTLGILDNGLLALGLEAPVVLSNLQLLKPSLSTWLLFLAVLLVILLLWPSSHKHKAVNGNHKMEEQFHDAQERTLFEGETKVPSHPHLQGSYIPSNGLLWSNAKDQHPFENDYCTGSFLPLHRPTYDKALDKSGEYPYGNHFHNKKRIWEMRFQFKFKLPPEKLWFGIELEEYVPLSWATERTQGMLVKLLQKVVGKNLYHSTGDTAGTERPVFAMPLWAFDQFLETPEGEEPPCLNTSDADSLGMRRTDDRKAFIRALENLKFRSGPTYTFCFWGISQYLDNIKWEVIWKIGHIDFNKFCGKPPVHVVLYELEPADGTADDRHLQSRKKYVFDLAFWSSRKPPSKARQRELLGVHSGERAENATSEAKRSWNLQGLLTCCAPGDRSSDL